MLMLPEPTLSDLFEVMTGFAAHVDANFVELKQEIGGLKHEVGRIEATMVTKNYLDDKLAQLRGEMMMTLRKEDTKVCALAGELVDNEALDKEAAARVCSLEPFPKT